MIEATPWDVPIATIAKYVPDSPVIVEAGACDGSHTAAMAALWPRGEVHAFEPVPAMCKELRSRVRGLSGVSVYDVALSDRDGASVMHVSGGASEGSSSLLAPKEVLTRHPDVTFEERIEVRTVSLDSWAERVLVPRVDFLWLDLQGAELAALRGAERLLRDVSAVYVEVNLVEVYEGVPLYPEVRAWLRERSFRVVEEALPEGTGAGNVLFARAA